MTLRDKVELLLICGATGVIWFFAAKLPQHLPAGEVILAASILLLGQGLIRDLWIKYVAGPQASIPQGNVAETPAARPKIICMCMESTVGAAGVIAGCAILLCGIRSSVELPELFWPLLVLIVGVAGFIIKDFVIDWKTWRIRREKDHQSVIFW